MHFDLLKRRLVEHIRLRVRGGELTERGVARLTGVSQPHLHNVLKGTKALSTPMADQVLRGLNLCLFDLREPHEWRLHGGESVPVPLFEGLLGPSLPWRFQQRPREFLRFPAPLLTRVADPVAVRLGADPRMDPLFHMGDLALLDCSENARQQPESDCCYVVEGAGYGLVRHVRLGGARLYLTSLDNPNPLPWDFISLADRNILEVVRAKIVWIGREPEFPSLATKSFDQTGREH